nr:uncharacterized protein LOC129438947 [Misgurnus anguillicaudatus]
MHITSSFIILFMMILNNLCEGKGNKNCNISLTPAEVTAVAGLCAFISSTFSYPNEAKPEILLLYQCTKGNNCSEFENTNVKMLTFVLDNKKFSINITNIRAEDKGECEIREEETKSDPYSSRFKFIIQVKPQTEGQEANLNCLVPFAYPKTLPDISWWIKQNKKGFKLKKITFTTSEGFYAATLTFMPTAGLHNATVECEARYGNININTSMTIEVKSLT